MKNNLRERVVESTIWTSYASGVIVIVDLIQLGLISRFLTLEEIGIFSILTVVVGLLIRVNLFSYDSSVIHFSDPQEKELNSLYVFSIAFSVLLFILG